MLDDEDTVRWLVNLALDAAQHLTSSAQLDWPQAATAGAALRAEVCATLWIGQSQNNGQVVDAHALDADVLIRQAETSPQGAAMATALYGLTPTNNIYLAYQARNRARNVLRSSLEKRLNRALRDG